MEKRDSVAGYRFDEEHERETLLDLRRRFCQYEGITLKHVRLHNADQVLANLGETDDTSWRAKWCEILKTTVEIEIEENHVLFDEALKNGPNVGVRECHIGNEKEMQQFLELATEASAFVAQNKSDFAGHLRDDEWKNENNLWLNLMHRVHDFGIQMVAEGGVPTIDGVRRRNDGSLEFLPSIYQAKGLKFPDEPASFWVITDLFQSSVRLLNYLHGKLPVSPQRTHRYPKYRRLIHPGKFGMRGLERQLKRAYRALDLAERCDVEAAAARAASNDPTFVPQQQMESAKARMEYGQLIVELLERPEIEAVADLCEEKSDEFTLKSLKGLLSQTRNRTGIDKVELSNLTVSDFVVQAKASFVPNNNSTVVLNGQCRLSVTKGALYLDGEPMVTKQDPDQVAYVAALIAAGRGVHLTKQQIVDTSEALREHTSAHLNRDVRDNLPSVVLSLIDSKTGSGNFLKDEAWIS